LGSRLKARKLGTDATGMRFSRWLVVGALALFASAAWAQSLEETLRASRRAYDQGQPREAVAVLEARIANPGPEDNLIQLRGTAGDLYMELNETERALRHYDWLIAQHPDSPLAHYKRGQALERTSALLEAIAAYRHAGELGHDTTEVLARSGYCYKVLAARPATTEADRTRYLRLARTNLEAAIERDPKHGSALGNLADLVFNQGEYGRALELYRRMDAFDPNRPTTLSRIGNTQLRLGEHQTALSFLLRAIKIVDEVEPANWGDRWVYRDVVTFSRVLAAECLIALGRPDEARRQIASVLEITDCSGCKMTSREVERSRTRAEELLAKLDSITPANAQPSR
jgi:tetratricopeptide (TPR) repeat protein